MESKLIDIQKFEKQEEIQTDEQKHTYILREKDTKDLYFAKATHDEVTKYTPISSITIDQEANILSKLDHPSIIQYVGFSPIDLEGKNKHVIITKYCKNGSLYSILQEKKIKLTDTQVRVKPNSFSIHRNTTDYQFKDPHYDDDQLEWRVGKPEDMFPYRLLFRHLSLDDYKPELHSYGKNFPYSTTKNSKIVFVPPNMETGKSAIGIGYRIGSILCEKKQ